MPTHRQAVIVKIIASLLLILILGSCLIFATLLTPQSAIAVAFVAMVLSWLVCLRLNFLQTDWLDSLIGTFQLVSVSLCAITFGGVQGFTLALLFGGGLFFVALIILWRA